MSAPTSAEIALTMAGSIPISALLQIAPAKTRSGAFVACRGECLNPRPIMVSCWGVLVAWAKRGACVLAPANSGAKARKRRHDGKDGHRKMWLAGHEARARTRDLEAASARSRSRCSVSGVRLLPAVIWRLAGCCELLELWG